MPNSTADRRAREIVRDLRRFGNPERRAVMTGGYAPSRLETLGVSVPDMRTIVRRVSAELRREDARDVLAVAQALVEDGTSEGRQVGYEVVARRLDAMRLLTPARVRRLGRGNDNWASVDGFATHLAGPAWRMGRLPDAEIRRWAASADRWWRRTALAATVALNVAARGGSGDTRRTLMVASRVVADPEPLVAKALSWALRSLADRDAAAVRAFLSRHGGRMPALVRREVATKLRTGRKATPRRPAS